MHCSKRNVGRNVSVFCLMTGSVGSNLNSSKECFGILNDSKIFSSVLHGSKRGWHNFVWFQEELAEFWLIPRSVSYISRLTVWIGGRHRSFEPGASAACRSAHRQADRPPGAGEGLSGERKLVWQCSAEVEKATKAWQAWQELSSRLPLPVAAFLKESRRSFGVPDIQCTLYSVNCTLYTV